MTTTTTTTKPVSSPVRGISDELIPTRDTLLHRLKDWQDEESWRDFFNIYWKLVYGFALRAGLNDQEAQEVVQETVITVARRIPEFHYDPERCSFKTWLLKLTRWRIVDQLRKRALAGRRNAFRAGDSSLSNPLDQLPDPATVNLDDVWETEWQQHLLDTAILAVKRKVNPEHYQAFHLCVFKEWPVRKVSEELDLSAAQVYLAKHRVAAVLKREIRALEKKLERSGGPPPAPDGP